MSVLNEDCVLNVLKYLTPNEWVNCNKMYLTWTNAAMYRISKSLQIVLRSAEENKEENVPVISFTDATDILKHCGSVIHHAELSICDPIYLRIDSQDFKVDNCSNDDFLNVFTQNCPNITFLKLKSIGKVPDLLAQYLQSNNNLKALRITASSFNDVICNIPNTVEELTLNSNKYRSLNFPPEVLSNLTSLVYLDLKNPTDLNISIVNKLIECTTRLKKLKFITNTRVSLQHAQLQYTNLSELEELHTEGLIHTKCSVNKLYMHCKKIRSIKIHTGAVLENPGLPALMTMPQLEVFAHSNIRYVPFLSDDNLPALGKMFLRLHCAARVKPNAVYKLILMSPSLHHLEINTMYKSNTLKRVIFEVISAGIKQNKVIRIRMKSKLNHLKIYKKSKIHRKKQDTLTVICESSMQLTKIIRHVATSHPYCNVKQIDDQIIETIVAS